MPGPNTKVSVSLDACLDACAPASGLSDGVLRIGLPLDAKQLALAGFDLCHYRRSKPVASDMHPAAQRFLDTIDSAGCGDEPVALMFYLDGSFASQEASFAVVCLGLFADQWKWIGYLADIVSEPITVSSAFEGELFAQLVALGTAAAVSVPATVFYDCQSAACVAGGQSSSGASTSLGRATTGLYMCSGVAGRWPTMQHVRSHQGHPINELADWLAKRVLTHVGARAPVGDDKIPSYVDQHAFDWLWLYQANQHSREWPAVDEDGDTIPVVPSPSEPPPDTPAGWALPSTAPPAQVSEFRLRLVSYNTLSCKAALQRQCLSQYMRANEVGVLGLQETRQELLDTAQVDGILRFGGPAPEGQLGCQAWFNLSVGPWQRACFRKTFQHERLLEVHARLGDQLLAFLVGHSPTAVAAAPVREQWWQMLHQRLQALPPGFQPILLLDANARHCLSNATEAPDNCNAHALDELMQRHGLQRTAAYEASGLPRVTWRPPSGVLTAGACLDYILGPDSWGSSIVAQGLLPIVDTHAGIDHEPVFADYHVRVLRPPRTSMTLDRVAMLTTDGKARLQAIYDAAPSVPWTVGPDEHLRIINEHLQRGLMAQFAGVQRPRKPAMSAATWRLLWAKRQLRRIHRRRATLHTKWILLQCLRAWQGHSVASPPAHVRRQKAFDYAAAAHVAGMQQITRDLRRAHQADEAEFVRLTYQDCRLQGPAALAKKLRSILRSGRRAVGSLPTSLQTSDGLVTDHNLVLQHFGKHFAKAEQASTVELALVPSLPCCKAPSVGIGDAPALADVCGAFASLKSGKAPGISGIPPEAYSACAANAALLHMPLMLKSLSRGRLPLLWTGLKAYPIPKPSKPQERVEGYRSIALAEPAGKAVTKAARRGLVDVFEKITVPTVGGSRPGFPVEVPALAVQAHLAMLRRTKRPGAAIFIDGISAFYAARRAHLFTADAAALHSHIASLALDDDVRQRVCSAIGECGALETGACPGCFYPFVEGCFYRHVVFG